MREYKSQKELYLNLIPALNVKMKLLKRNNYKNITREDVWSYLRDNKWKYSVDLTLADMVQDIIHTDNLEISNFIKNNKSIV